MACYIITYDLQKGSSEDYEALREAIKSYGTWARITESTWAIVTDESASEIRDYLFEVMHEGDRLFVVKSGVAGAWKNVRCRNSWLKDHL